MPDLIAQAIMLDRKIAYAFTDHDLKVVEIGGLAKLFQRDPADCLGCSLTEIVPELECCEEALFQVLTGELSRFKLAWVNRDLPNGETAFLTMVGLPLRDESGRIAGLIHLVHDVTDTGILGQRLTQERLATQHEQLATANAELRRLDEVKSAFISIAAHELRTPLTSILGYLELLLSGDAGALTEQQADYLHIMEDGAQRLARITNDLLDVTRIEAGQMDLVLRSTDLASLLKGVVAEHAPQLITSSQRMMLNIPAGLPPVLCDVARVSQIVGNLLDNASKYSPPGSTITLSVQRAADAGFLQVSVADQGGGIVSEDQVGIFRPFFRAGSATLSGINGTGLGLFIARSLVDLHGGRIWLDSSPGEGATFHITLSIAEHSPAQ